jgi:BlaI family transcriptional regulator, penicillinase repressor
MPIGPLGANKLTMSLRFRRGVNKLAAMSPRSAKIKDLTARERQIMDVVYGRGKASVAEVIGEMPDAPNYSTIRTLMGILEKKGHLKHKEEDGRYVYLPVIPQVKARNSALKRLVKTFFNNSVDDTVLALLELRENQDTDAMDRLSRLIEKAKAERKS